MNENVIWNYLMGKINNQYGVAALMGNLFVESRLNPRLLQGTYATKLGMTNDTYTSAVDYGTYSSENFINDKAGYGLAQWTYWSRKKSLYDYAKSNGKSIGDLNMQLDFLWSEIQLYKTVVESMKTGKSVREISDVICKRYLKPANQSEKYLQNRANFGQGYYDNFAKSEDANEPETPEKKPEKAPETTSEKRIVATANVNIRAGNGKGYEKLGLLKAGTSVPWIATSVDGWHAFAYNKRVCWVSGEFSEVK